MKPWQRIVSVISTILPFVGFGLIASLLAPFYPAEARQIGATPSQYGFVLGIVNLGVLISSPVFAKYGPRIGIQLCFLMGVADVGISAIVFSSLVLITDVTTFLLLSYLLRFIMGVGCGMAWASGISSLIDLIPQYEASALAWVESGFGFGVCVGPAAGAWMYSIGGFKLPFLVNGFYMIGMAILLALTIYRRSNKVNYLSVAELSTEELTTASSIEYTSSTELNEEFVTRNGIAENPKILSESDGQTKPLLSPTGNSNSDEEKDIVGETANHLSLSGLKQHPQLLLPMIDVFISTCCEAMLESMVELHLTQEVGLNKNEVAITFLIHGSCYLIGNISVGYVIDKLKRPHDFSVLGNFYYVIVLIWIGPVPFINIAPTKVLVRVMMLLAGLAYAIQAVSTFSRIQKMAISHGFADNIDTTMFISGLWASFFSGGFAIGPLIGGVLVDYYGFRTCTSIFLLPIVTAFLIDVSLFFKKC